MGLKIKISSGYILLILLLAIIIYLFRGEEVRRETLRKEESELADMRRLTAKAYMSLLDLSSQAEVASVWTESDFNAYCVRQEAVHETLKSLRYYIHPPGQQARIDSFNLLLEEKKLLLATVMNILNSEPDVSEIVSEKILVIVSQVRKEPIQTDNEVPEPEKKQEPAKGKKKSIWNIFRKKETKSAYLRQWEQITTAPKSTVRSGRPSVAVPLLHSLNREVVEKRKEQQEKLFLQMDSLYASSQNLNRKLNTLIADYEKEAELHLSSAYETLITSREKSFYIASGLAAFVFLIAIMLYIIVHRDVNRRYRYEKALELSDRRNKDMMQLRQNMMLTVSHDLRAPLTAIIGYAELLSGERRKEKRTRYSETIRQSADRMFGLLNTLLKFCRLDTGKEQPDNNPFRLKLLSEITKQNHTLQAQNKGLIFTSEYIGDDVVVMGDREKLLQIIDNLLSNAVKFTEEGEVSVHLHYNENLLTIKVRDSGTGMTASQKQQIFLPFERLGNAETQEGFGLGLAITLATVKLLGGKIHVESKKGKGSLFTVEIPLPFTDGKSPILRTDMPGIPAGLRVLVMDDDPVLSAMTLDMLSRGGISCDGCRSVRDLTENLREHPYDLLITDIKMPVMNGYQLLELLRGSNVETFKTIPVLAVTACADRDTDDFTKAGFTGCLYKPFSQNELLSAIRDCVSRKQDVNIPVQVDFSALLSGERDGREMLGLFINEILKSMEALEATLSTGDLEAVSFITHHSLPLGELVRENGSLKSLQCLLRASTGIMNDGIKQAIREVIAQGCSIAEQARIKMEQIENWQ